MPARPVRRVGDDVADVSLAGVHGAGALVADQRSVAARILAAACCAGPDDRSDLFRDWLAPWLPEGTLREIRNALMQNLFVSKLIHDLFGYRTRGEPKLAAILFFASSARLRRS